MAKEAPAITVNLDDSANSSRDISNDVNSLSWRMPRATQEITGVDKSAVERLKLLANLSHAVLKDHNTTTQERDMSLVMSGQTLTSDVWITSYDLDRPITGELTWTSEIVLADGVAPAWS
jgi:hypothetical protein